MKPEGRLWVLSLCTPFPVAVRRRSHRRSCHSRRRSPCRLRRQNRRPIRRRSPSTHVHPQRKQRALLD